MGLEITRQKQRRAVCVGGESLREGEREREEVLMWESEALVSQSQRINLTDEGE